MFITSTLDSAIVQAVSRWLLTAETWFRAQVTPSGICVGQSGTTTGFSPSPSGFPVSIIPPLLHIPSHIIWRMHKGGAGVAQSVWCLTTDWMTGDRGSISGIGKRIFPLTCVSRPALRHTQPPVKWAQGVFPPGGKLRPKSDADLD
jgi:hypothetical protein